jgi:hypothetical protein
MNLKAVRKRFPITEDISRILVIQEVCPAKFWGQGYQVAGPEGDERPSTPEPEPKMELT